MKPDVLTVEEAECLINACPTGTALERRDRMVILLLYGCGLRTKELCDLRIQDVNTERKELFIRAGKGDLQRIVPIPEGVFTELLAYLLERGGKRGALLRTENRKPLRAILVCKIVHQAAERAKMERPVVPKMLRHSYASHLMDRGVNLAVIARLMGHRSPSETGVYLHASPGRPREAVERLTRKKDKEDQEKDDTSGHEEGKTKKGKEGRS